MKEFLSEKEVKYVYLDITESMYNLKSFLKYRDNSPEFNDIKKSGRIGLPCIVINNGEHVFFDTTLDIDYLKE